MCFGLLSMANARWAMGLSRRRRSLESARGPKPNNTSWRLGQPTRTLGAKMPGLLHKPLEFSDPLPLVYRPIKINCADVSTGISLAIILNNKLVWRMAVCVLIFYVNIIVAHKMDGAQWARGHTFWKLCPPARGMYFLVANHFKELNKHWIYQLLVIVIKECYRKFTGKIKG